MKRIMMLTMAWAASWSSAQTPLKELAVPPHDAQHFSIVSTAGKHGESARWTTAGGDHLGRESMNLRGQIFELDSVSHAGKNGLPLLPAGKLRAELLTTAVVGAEAQKKTVTAYALIGLDTAPTPVWVDGSGRFFALVAPISWLPVGYEGDLLALQKAQDDALAKSPAIAKSLLKTPGGPVAFTNVRAFLDGARFAEGQTVLVDKGLITAVGPSASVALPPRAQVIDGKGKTLVPGLWDSHRRQRSEHSPACDGRDLPGGSVGNRPQGQG